MKRLTKAARLKAATKIAHESPTTWFCMLEQALRTGDREREAIARRELNRLGVCVYVDEERAGFQAAAGARA